MDQIKIVNFIKKLKDQLGKRVLSAITILPIILLSIIIGDIFFLILLLITLILLSFEASRILIASNWRNNIKFYIYIGLYIFTATISLYYIAIFKQQNIEILFLFSVIWLNDIFAYYIGKKVKGPKLAPRISPNKTISGFLGGILGGVLISISFYLFSKNISLLAMIILATIISILAVIGDLIESFIKRKLKIKDSGCIIPGHGGMFDRLDSILFTSPFFALYISTSNIVLF
jgi:phosphatidate cytidylyltransferase